MNSRSWLLGAVWITVAAVVSLGAGPAPLLTFEARDAVQGVAVDAANVYVIDNRVIAKHDKFTGELVKRWSGERGQTRPEASRLLGAVPPGSRLTHMNSAMVRKGRLYAAHSNCPNVPMTSSVEIWDAKTLEHVDSHSFGRTDGSLTWMDWHDGHWWGCFAHYATKAGYPGKGPEWSTLVKFDAKWRRVEAWAFPPEVINRVKPNSCSGGSWGPDGLLYVAGHDRPELCALRLPKMGSTLEYLGVVPFPIKGQAIAFDRSGTGLLYGIVRADSTVVAAPFEGFFLGAKVSR
ncbi:MAG: hypothetical protein GY851_19060 [bacterium]|nr:hypothetical protein [bacterium]